MLALIKLNTYIISVYWYREICLLTVLFRFYKGVMSRNSGKWTNFSLNGWSLLLNSTSPRKSRIQSCMTYPFSSTLKRKGVGKLPFPDLWVCTEKLPDCKFEVISELAEFPSVSCVAVYKIAWSSPLKITNPLTQPVNTISTLYLK